MTRRYCPQGHDTEVYGRNASGRCRECTRIAAREDWRRKAKERARKKALLSQEVEPNEYLALVERKERAATWWEREEIERQMRAMREEANDDRRDGSDA